MKKLNWFFYTILISMVFCSTGLAREVAYQTATPAINYITLNSKYDVQSLSSTLYVSDNEIWLAGVLGSSEIWLVCINANGEILSERTIVDAPGNYPRTSCISKVGDTLLLGFIDAENQSGNVGILRSSDGQVIYYPMKNNVKVMDMVFVPTGIMTVGVIYDTDNNVSSLYSSLTAATGEMLFEKSDVITTNMTTDEYALSSSKGTASVDDYFIQANVGRESRLQPEKLLIKLDASGNEQWRVSLPDTFSTQKMSTSDGYIYLYGVSGDLNEYDTLANHKAAIYCFSLDGVEQWQQVFDKSDRFSYGTSGNGVSVAIEGSAKQDSWHMCSLDTMGSPRNMVSVEFSAPSYMRGIYLTPSGHAKVIGVTNSQLFMFDMPY